MKGSEVTRRRLRHPDLLILLISCGNGVHDTVSKCLFRDSCATSNISPIGNKAKEITAAPCKRILWIESMYISGFRARQHTRSLAPVMNEYG